MWSKQGTAYMWKAIFLEGLLEVGEEAEQSLDLAGKQLNTTNVSAYEKSYQDLQHQAAESGAMRTGHCGRGSGSHC